MGLLACSLQSFRTWRFFFGESYHLGSANPLKGFCPSGILFTIKQFQGGRNMKRKRLTMLGVVIFVCMIAASIYAQGVLNPSQKVPAQVVSARKFAMGAIAGNAGSTKGKIDAGDIKGVAVHAKSIAALATFLPLAYDETYSQVYPVKGSKYFFKRAAVADMVTGFMNLRKQAEALMKLASADDKSGVEAQLGKLFGSCGACHKATRGKY
jgi:hypothetical protein